MKKFFYIVAFVFFGLIVSTLIHTGLELFALDLIFNHPERFANTFWWQEWHLLHRVVSGVLWFLGFWFGVYYGLKYWEPYGSKPGFYHWRKR